MKKNHLIQNLDLLTKVIQQTKSLTAEQKNKTLFGRLDARSKLFGSILFLIIGSLIKNPLLLGFLLSLILGIAFWGAKLRWQNYFRPLLGVLFFTTLLTVPALFLLGGEKIIFWGIAISWVGLQNTLILTLRVCYSLAVSLLLLNTSSWFELTKALSFFRIPAEIILILDLTYRYLVLLLSTAQEMLLARKCRLVGQTDNQTERKLILDLSGSLLNRTFQKSEEVHLAMLARGFTGNIPVSSNNKMTRLDYIFLLSSCSIGLLFLFFNYFR